MAEGTYEYECNRAELLGVAPPKFEDWQEQDKVRREQEQIERAAVSACTFLAPQLLHESLFQELVAQEEQIDQSSGKIDEVNNILLSTQRRLDKFKASPFSSPSNSAL